MQNVWPVLILVLSYLVAGAAEPAKFELVDDDRVVLLGNTLIEREQKYGYWELMLTMAWPERNVTFRNLGWSGDTVWGESRAGFGTPADGFKALVEQMNAAKPTVIFVGYGNVEAFDGETGLPRFVEGFNKLLDELEKTKARIVVLGPVRMNAQFAKNPNAQQYNDAVVAYDAALGNIASLRGARFMSLLGEPTTAAESFLTLNGLDLTDAGYQHLTERCIAPSLGVNLIDPWEFPNGSSPELETYNALVAAILKKNELFFHRWRPQNETYLFGFRKHEQGNNAQEVFEFDPLVAAEEKEIAELRTKLAAELKEASDAK